MKRNTKNQNTQIENALTIGLYYTFLRRIAVDAWTFEGLPFDDDDILDGKFIYNYGVMNEEMKKAIGKVLDYGIYKQTIIEMDFSAFKDLYEENRLKIELLDAKYPGIAI